MIVEKIHHRYHTALDHVDQTHNGPDDAMADVHDDMMRPLNLDDVVMPYYNSLHPFLNQVLPIDYT